MQVLGVERNAAMTLVIVLVAVAGFCSCLPSQTDSEPAERPSGKLPALLDYNHYLAVFKKDYRSELETTVRKIYFLASAFMVYTKAIAYKFRKSSSYFALNHMSDWSPQELGRMKNKVLTNRIESQLTTGQNEPAQSGPDEGEVEMEFGSESSDIVTAELEGKIRRELEEARLDEVLELHEVTSRKKRFKRDTKAQSTHSQGLPPRQLSMDQLIHTPTQHEPITPKTKLNPESNNPHYDPLALETTTMGLKDQLEPVRIYDSKIVHYLMKKAVRQSLSPAMEKLKSVFSPLRDLVVGEREIVEHTETQLEPDKMFVDLRESGCLSPVRHQGQCGSCYAFAGIALVEYLYCNQTNSLVEFSEQYLVDCGLGRVSKMNGCDGGTGDNLPHFIHNFGLELRSHYPYLGKVSECPYNDDIDLKKTGFIRMPLRKNLLIPINEWEQQLKAGPLYIVVTLPPNFDRYGGGVDSGRDCHRNEENHAMLLVGHGREDGQEFWLIRNSYGTSWGEKGYYKLAKSVNESCIDLQAGYVYGTKDGKRFKIKPERNELNRRLQASGE